MRWLATKLLFNLWQALMISDARTILGFLTCPGFKSALEELKDLNRKRFEVEIAKRDEEVKRRKNS